MSTPDYANLIGKTVGRWRIESLCRDRAGLAVFVCVCSCGTRKTVAAHSIARGDSRSCGCLATELKRQRATTHGGHDLPEYTIWQGMLNRCRNPKQQNYHLYGGKGIKVCDRWVHSFEAFYQDMGPRPSDQHSIERNHSDGDYTPSNCRWATAKEQGRNTSRNVNLTLNGETLCMTDWAERIGVTTATIRNRLRAGLPIEKVLAPPTPLKLRRQVTYARKLAAEDPRFSSFFEFRTLRSMQGA